MKSYVKFLTIFILTIIGGFIPLRNTTLAINLGTAISPLGLDPTVDAKLETAEWINSSIYYYLLYNIDNQLDTIDLQFRTSYSATNLTLGITIYDDNPIASDVIVVFFKVNTSSDLLHINGGNPYFENGNDAKVLYVNNNTFDSHTSGSFFNAYFDTDNVGGTDDMFGKAAITPGVKVDFEMTMPLNTGDIPESADIALEAGDSVEIFFWYYVKSVDYSGFRNTDLDYNSYILELQIPPEPEIITLPPETITQNNTITITVESGIILTASIIGTFTVMMFVVFISRKWKK